jgi:hypothetical protein
LVSTPNILADYDITGLHVSIAIPIMVLSIRGSFYKHRIRAAAVGAMHIRPQNSAVPHRNRDVALNDYLYLFGF